MHVHDCELMLQCWSSAPSTIEFSKSSNASNASNAIDRSSVCKLQAAVTFKSVLQITPRSLDVRRDVWQQDVSLNCPGLRLFFLCASSLHTQSCLLATTSTQIGHCVLTCTHSTAAPHARVAHAGDCWDGHVRNPCTRTAQAESRREPSGRC